MNKTGKYLFLLLALCLLLALLPVTAFATGTTEVSTWEGLQAALSAGGDIVLTGDVAPENPYWAYALTVPSDVTATLDLNGHSVDRGYGNQTEPGFDGSVMIINGTLTVTDSASGGSITGGFPDQYGGGVQIQGGTFNLLGGSITGNSVGKTDFFGTQGLGGGVYMQSGTFNMSGGSISGNKALGSSMGSSLGRGGGVYVTGGTFNFTGGTISGNTAGSIGGGVYLASSSSGHDGRIKVSGGAITGNTVAGAASNVYLEEGGVLAVTGALTGTIGVTMQIPGVFTDGLSGKGTKENFTSDDAGLVVSLTDAGEAKLGVEEYPLWVGGVQVTSANKGDILNDGCTASYDPDSNTLTLNNANITGMYQGHPLNRSIRTENMDLTVALTGSNTVSGRIALAVYGDLTITGGGSLTATGSASEGIYARGNLTIDGCTISASAAKNYAIFCRGDLAITDSNVTATSEAACAFSSSGGSLTISGDSRLSAQATDSAIKLNNGFDIGEGLGVTTPTDGYVDGNSIKDSDGNTAKSVVIERLSTYSVTVTPGANMTLTSGAASQTVTAGGAMESVVYTADEGYYFPEDYTVDSVNGVAVTRDSFTQITVSGTPTGNAAITLTAPMAKTKPDAPTAAAEDCTTSDNNDGKLTGVTTAMEYKKSDAENWTAGAGSDIENLVPGTYYVRVKATDTTLASDNQELEIKEFISYTVTFKVVNGSWNEGEGDAATADKTVTLTGHDGDSLKLAADQIPAVGTKPNGTYKAGSWDTTPSADTVITGATTYTYTYAAKETATVTKAPEAKTLTYNGHEQELVTAGTATGGEMQYALGTATEATQPYTTAIPTATDAGTYYVWYKAVGDSNHTDSKPVCVTVTIGEKIVYTAVKTSATVDEHTIGSGEDAVLVFQRSVDDAKTIEHFTSAAVDGKTLSAGDYSVKSGSLILTLKASYLDTLTPGTHQVTATFDDGSADTTITILEAPATAAPTNVPKTGDGADLGLWLTLMLAGLLLLGGWAVYTIRKRS